CLFLGILVKRSAFALGFLLVWSILEGVFFGLMKWVFFRGTNVAESVIQFFPLESMSILIREPFSKLGIVKTAATQLGESFYKDHDVQWLAVFTVLLWTALFIYGSYYILKKRDL